MSIKNVSKSSTSVPVEETNDVPPQTKAPQTLVKTSPKPSVQKTVQTEQVTQSAEEHAVTIKELQKIATSTLVPPAESEPSQAIISAPVQSGTLNEATAEVTESGTAPTNEQTKKKRKKRVLESIESEESSALRPTLVTEDREAEVRPE